MSTMDNNNRWSALAGFTPVLNTFVTEEEGVLTDTRFVRLEGKELDYKLRICLFRSGYIDISALPVSGTICVGETIPAPPIFVRCDSDCVPWFAQADIPARQLLAEEFPDFILFMQQLQKNTEAIDSVIQAIRGGERFQVD